MTGALLTLAEFRTLRDQLQLASMRDRLPVLHARADVAWDRYQTELAEVNTKLKGKWTDSCRALANEWQAIEADITNIGITIPVIEARLAAEPSVVSLVDSMMATFGFKKAAGE